MLEINIRKAQEVPGVYSCFLKFSHYNQSWIEIIRQFNCRKYNKETTEWEFPFYNLKDILSRYPNLPVKIHFKNDNAVKDSIRMPELHLKKELFSHQKIAVEYGLNNPKYLLLDTMGIGKTASVIAEAIALKQLGKIKQCLIICCVSDLQYNWEKEIINISEKERLDADYNLKSWLDILYAEEERDYDKIYEIEDLLNKLSSNSIDKDIWAKIQEYAIARERIRDKAHLKEEPKTIYQVCFDTVDHHDHIKSVVCYETDSEYDAKCYIGEMYHLGDYSNYYVRVKKENNNDN